MENHAKLIETTRNSTFHPNATTNRIKVDSMLDYLLDKQVSNKLSCCCAIGCTNRHSKGFSMKSFPKDPWRRKVWIKNINRKNWTPTKKSYLCEIHFAPIMWVDGKKRLKQSAIPTIFPHVPPENVHSLPSKTQASVIIKEPETLEVNAVQNEGSSFVESKEASTSVSAVDLNEISNTMIKQEENDINSMNQTPSVTIKEEPIVSSIDSDVYGGVIKEEHYEEVAEVNGINISIKQIENGVKECCVWIPEEPQCPLINGAKECYLCISGEPLCQLQLDPLNNARTGRPRLKLTTEERKSVKTKNVNVIKENSTKKKRI